MSQTRTAHAGSRLREQKMRNSYRRVLDTTSIPEMKTKGLQGNINIISGTNSGL